MACTGTDESPTPGSKALRYFGFALVNTYWDDPTDDSTKSNYADEVASFSNIADLIVVSPSDDISSQLEAFGDLKLRAYIHISELFFELTGSDAPSGADYTLRADYKQRWDSFFANNQSALIKEEPIFYLGEEPTWNGITTEELSTAAQAIKQKLPQAIIMLVEAYPALQDLVVPKEIDWIGFDQYFIASPATNSSYQKNLRLLKSKLSTEGQRIVIIMDSHYISDYHGKWAQLSINDMAQVAESYYQVAQSEPKAIALIGYFWPSGFDNPSSIGARGMPDEVKQKYQQMGRLISGKD